MKKFYYLLSGLTIFILTFISCEASLIESENTLSSQKNPSTPGTFITPETICRDSPAQFCFEAPTGSKLKADLWDEHLGDWVRVYQTSDSENNPACFPLTFNTEGEHKLKCKIDNGKFVATSIRVQNCINCDESFSYVENEEEDDIEDESETYTFTYIPANSKENALVVFTFAQSVAVSGFEEEGWSNNGQTMQKEMELKACEVYTWEIRMEKDCNGSAPNDNLWTDFKVDDVSKKNTDTPTIVHQCN